MPSDHPRTPRGKARRRNKQQDARRETNSTESHSDEGSESGGSLWAILLPLVGIPVGWFVSVAAAMLVIGYFIAPDASIALISGFSEQETLWASVVVVGLVVGTMLVRPKTILVGWGMMGILVALVASFISGWTTLFIIFEGVTIGYTALAAFLSVLIASDKGIMAALLMDRWLR